MNSPVSQSNSNFANMGAADPYFGGTCSFVSGPVDPCPQDTPPETQSQVPPNSVPAEDSAKETTESYDIDIRMFQTDEPASVQPLPAPMPIRGGLAVHEPESRDLTPEAQPRFINQNAEGHFVAAPGSIAVIDGDEGYDYVDLTRYDIRHATFGKSCIQIVDPDNGSSFTVKHRNIPLAVFAGGQRVGLSG